ncbi:hypothetical protein CRG98_024175 [Punica granatum]|uniref:Uncharacterized protein n=1 Tax=Punica granatum TaxID=22663 RepID=A0A2I0JGM4_PUNGR|nr:hypothetical protein CRG98_024175 [Punica granatum]
MHPLFPPSFCCVGCTELLGRRVQLPTALEEGFPLGRLNGIGEPIGDRIEIDNLATSLGDPLSAQSGFVLCPVSLFETPQLCMAEAALAPGAMSPIISCCSLHYVPLGGCTLLKSLDVQGRRLHRYRVIRSIGCVFNFVGGTSSWDTFLVKACVVTLGKAREAGSPEDKQIE